MATAERILTDEMIEQIRRYFPRYPSRQAVTLPALHVVNEHLRYVPPQAVAEIAELLDLAPAEVQDTLSFYGFFKQDKPHGRKRIWVCRSISCELRVPGITGPPPRSAGHSTRPDHERRTSGIGDCRVPGGLRSRPLHARRRRAAALLDERVVGRIPGLVGVDRETLWASVNQFY